MGFVEGTLQMRSRLRRETGKSEKRGIGDRLQESAQDQLLLLIAPLVARLSWGPLEVGGIRACGGRTRVCP